MQVLQQLAILSPSQNGVGVERFFICEWSCSRFVRWVDRRKPLIFEQPDTVDSDGASDILDLLLTHVLEREGEFVAHLVADDAADANSAGFRQGFEPCRDIDPVAIDIAPVLDDVTEIDPHAENSPGAPMADQRD
jgi:hypothetical protein